MDLLHDLILKLMLTAKRRAKGIRIYLFILLSPSGHLAEAVLSGHEG